MCNSTWQVCLMLVCLNTISLAVSCILSTESLRFREALCADMLPQGATVFPRHVIHCCAAHYWGNISTAPSISVCRKQAQKVKPRRSE